MAASTPPPTSPPSATGQSQVAFGSGGTASSSTGPAVLGSLFGVDQSLLNVPTAIDLPDGWTPSPGAVSPISTDTIAHTLAVFHRTSNDERNAMAAKLEAAGYLPPIPAGSKKKRNPDAIYNAYRDALIDATSAGVSVTKWVSDQANGAGGAMSDQSSKSTNPLDAQALGNTTALSSLGYGLSPDQQSQFAGQFAAAEAPYNQSDATVSAPSAAGWAQWAKQQVREVDPKRFDALQVVHTMDAIRQMLGSSDASLTGRAPSPDSQANQ